MQTCAIVNPVAGSGRVQRLWPTLKSRLEDKSQDLSILRTSAPKEATDLTRSALRAGAERIVSVGGDGTLHEVVNGFFDEDGTQLSSSACLTPIPCGTGTDFRRSLNIPFGIEASSLLDQERPRSIDLLRVGYTNASGQTAWCYAVNITSFGLSSHVARHVNQDPNAWLPGSVRYFGAILRAVWSHRLVPVRLTLDQSLIPISPIRLVAVANGHTFGGGIRIAPTARFNDGRLSVTILDDTSIGYFLRHLPHFYRGTHRSLNGVTTLEGQTMTAQPRTDVPVWLEADGEVLGRLPVQVEVVPNALRVQY